MERKTKHRILGIFVVIGFVIILLPFFQGGKEPQTAVGLVKSPEFPDQSVQVSATPEEPVATSPVSIAIPQQVAATGDPVNEQPDDTIDPNKASVNAEAPDMTKPAAETQTPETAKPVAKATESGKISDLTPAPSAMKSADEIAQMSDEVLTPKNIDSTNKTVDATPANDTHVVSAEKSEPKIAKIVSASKKIAKISRHMRDPKMVAAYKKLPIENDGLFKLKNAVWVVQIGSFKNKTNALRLVNQLRSNGYRAFIQQISTTLGNNTRVFIGPENKQASARALASQVEADMHIHGIVISYKPLTL